MNNLVAVAVRYLGVSKPEIKQMYDYYNSEVIHLVPHNKRYTMPYGAPWCGLFVSVVARIAGYSRNEFPYGVSVYEMVSQAKQWGNYQEGVDGIKEGDLIVYDWLNDGSFSHIGLVQGVKGDNISTIEGNYSNTVKERFIMKSAKAIRGYISLGGVYITTPKRRLEMLAERVILGEFGNGQERKIMLGSDYDKVQKIINQLLS